MTTAALTFQSSVYVATVEVPAYTHVYTCGRHVQLDDGCRACGVRHMTKLSLEGVGPECAVDYLAARVAATIDALDGLTPDDDAWDDALTDTDATERPDMVDSLVLVDFPARQVIGHILVTGSVTISSGATVDRYLVEVEVIADLPTTDG